MFGSDHHDPATREPWPDGSIRCRAKSERVYRPANKKEWRSVYWLLERVPAGEPARPSDIFVKSPVTEDVLRYRKKARKQYSFSATKYGEQAARRKAEAILQFIDITGLLPPQCSINATTVRTPNPRKEGTRKSLEGGRRSCPASKGTKRHSVHFDTTTEDTNCTSEPSTPGSVSLRIDQHMTAVSSSESVDLDYLKAMWTSPGESAGESPCASPGAPPDWAAASPRRYPAAFASPAGVAAAYMASNLPPSFSADAFAPAYYWDAPY